MVAFTLSQWYCLERSSRVLAWPWWLATGLLWCHPSNCNQILASSRTTILLLYHRSSSSQLYPLYFFQVEGGNVSFCLVLWIRVLRDSSSVWSSWMREMISVDRSALQLINCSSGGMICFRFGILRWSFLPDNVSGLWDIFPGQYPMLKLKEVTNWCHPMCCLANSCVVYHHSRWWWSM